MPLYACRQYHLDTSYHRAAMAPHSLDWANQPDVFKAYPAGEYLDLNDIAIDLPETSLWEAAAGTTSVREPADIKRADLARLLFLAYRLTAQRRHAGGTFYYRSVASAGALYPTELYVLITRSEDIDVGLYHYAIGSSRLIRLRHGDLSPHLAALAPHWRHHLPVAAFFISGIFFRSAWKYRQRAYRYVLLDGGHLLANLILAQKALGFPVRTTCDFDDGRVNTLMGIDDRREVCLVCAAVPGGTAKKKEEVNRDDPQPLPDDIRDRSRVSATEASFAEIGKIHAAGCTSGPEQGAAPGVMTDMLGIASAKWREFEKSKTCGDERGLPAAILKRRSRRNYVRQPLSRNRFIRLLDLVWLTLKHDPPVARPVDTTVSVGFLAGGIDGLDAGFYLLDAEQRRYGLVKGGALVEKMAAVCLDQQWLAQAAVHFLFMTNLECLDSWFGPRGYRHALLSAGRLGQIVYLGATALGLGACGIGALYDDEARTLLGLNAESALLYLVAAGPIKRP